MRRQREMKWMTALSLLAMSALAPSHGAAEDQLIRRHDSARTEPAAWRVRSEGGFRLLGQDGPESDQDIADILARYRARGISRAQAKKRLYPHVRKQVADELATVGGRAEALRAELAGLEAMVQDPDGAVERRIEQFLGEPTVTPAP